MISLHALLNALTHCFQHLIFLKLVKLLIACLKLLIKSLFLYFFILHDQETFSLKVIKIKVHFLLIYSELSDQLYEYMC